MTPKTPTPSDHPNLIPTEDEFAAWCDSPVTRWVALSHAMKAVACQVEWSRVSWDGGNASEALLTELRARADTFNGFPQSAWLDHLATVNPHVHQEVFEGRLNGALEPIKQPEPPTRRRAF